MSDEIITWWCLTEFNEWEAEVWNFYIPVVGNEVAILSINSYLLENPSDEYSTRIFRSILETLESLPGSTTYMDEHGVFPGAKLNRKKIIKDLTEGTFYDKLEKAGIIREYVVKGIELWKS